MVILAAVTLKVLSDYGLINFVAMAAETYTNEQQRENDMLKDLANTINKYQGTQDEETKGQPIQININVKSFNSSLGSFPMVFSIIGEKNGTTVYEDMISETVDRAGTKSLNLTINIPEGSKIKVIQEYSGANYDLTSEQIVQKDVQEGTIEFNFDFEYNYKIIQNYN